ncbi:DM13 domain-containing protein [Streptomyces sp. MS191]|uniref:DM13 domain-containing protein n=1 Tax=Streptomyces sp. ms191 TaxID=1827978 RepID=UPI003966F011
MGRVRTTWWLRGAVVSALLLVAGLVWFEPWALWTDETVREAPPSASEPATRPSAGTPAAEPVTEARGTFVSHEHPTKGTVRIVRLGDGTAVLRIEGLDTSSGPDVRVWLSDAPVRAGRAGWHVFDDGRHLSLGALKGNKGDQNYPLPRGVDWQAYPSVSIWCDRFDVSFGAASLVRT